MISMAELARHRPNPAALFQDFDISHTHCVRSERTQVNVENVLCAVDYAFMSDESAFGAKLRELKNRSGKSMRQIASDAGYRTASGVQRYFDGNFDRETLPEGTAEKLAKGLSGTKLSEDDIWSVIGRQEVQRFKPLGPITDDPQDVPAYGTALGTLLEVGGAAIEQTYLSSGDVITYFSRPSALRGRTDVYGFYVQGSSMAPRFDEGEPSYAETVKPPRAGDYAIIYLVGPDGNDGEEYQACLIKRWVRRTAQFVELEQFNPPALFQIPASRVKTVHRVIPWGELLA